MFWNILIAIAAYALQLILTPKPQNAKPAALEDFNLPIAEEGAELPVLFGTRYHRFPNVTWWGDLKVDPIKGARRYGFFGPRQIVGYKYSLGIQMTLCHGPADALYEIHVGEKKAWDGFTGQGPVTIDKPELFGGKEREGGIEGTIDVEMGYPAQDQNDYLIAQLGANVPAFRGTVTIVLRQVYLGTTPYIKPWDFLLQRIYVKSDGTEQWYPEKAGIGESSVFEPVVNQELESPLSIAMVDWGTDIKDGYVANITSGGGISVWKYPDMSNPIWTDAGDSDNQALHIDDMGNLIVAERDLSAEVRVYDIATGALSATIPGMGSGNTGLTSITLAGITYIVKFGGAKLNLAQGTGTAWVATAEQTVSYAWLSTCSSMTISPANIYLARNGLSAHLSGGSKQKVLIVPWSPAGFGPEHEVDLASELYGDILTVTYVAEQDAILIIDDGSGVHLFSADLSERLVSRRDEDQWTLGHASHLLSSRPFAGPDLISFRATGVVVSGNVVVKYRLSDLSLVSVTDAGDYHYVHAANTAMSNSGVDPDYDFMIVLGTSGVANLSAWSLPASSALDMNPAHIIREALTDPIWGMGYNEADIDDDAFTYAADLFYDEGMGLSLFWAREEQIEEFVRTILAHADAVLYVSRVSGKFVLKPIRQDYDIDTIPVLTEDDIVQWDEVSRRQPAEVITSGTVEFYDRVKRKDGSHTYHNSAQIAQFGGQNHMARVYPGFAIRALAVRAIERDVKGMGAGMISGRITCKRTVEGMNPGDPFRIVSTRHNLDGQVMRVVDGRFGDGRENRIALKFAQDVFTLNAEPIGDPTGTGWTDPSNPPGPMSPRLVQEAPWYELTQAIGPSDAATLLAGDPDGGLFQAAGSRPTSDAIDATLSVDSGAGYADADIMSFAPGALLAANVEADDTSITVTGGKDLTLATGMLAVILGASPAASEIVRVTNVAGTTLTVSRGLLDTVPRAHSSGTAIVVYDDAWMSDFEPYTDAASVGVKMRPRTSKGILSVAAAPADTVVFAHRAIRPLRPANVTVNGQGYGVVDLTGVDPIPVAWARRNRLTETTPLAWSASDQTPEAGQTTTITLKDQDGVVVHTETGIAGTSFNIDPADFGSATSGFIAVSSARDGYTSWQPYELPVLLGAEVVTLDADPVTIDGETVTLET